jgi:hypothetical protein
MEGRAATVAGAIAMNITKSKRKPGKSSPASFAFTCPRPTLRDSTKEMDLSFLSWKIKTLWQRWFQHHQRAVEADFFGASPVASALGTRSGATPFGQHQTNTHPLPSRSQQERSTLRRIGTF